MEDRDEAKRGMFEPIQFPKIEKGESGLSKTFKRLMAEALGCEVKEVHKYLGYGNSNEF